MLGQAQPLRRRSVLLAAISLLVLVAPAAGGTKASPSRAALRAQEARISAKSRAAVLGLYSLDQQLAGARTRLAALRTQVSTLRIERLRIQHQLAVAKRTARAAQDNLGATLRTLYEQGNVEPLEVVFGAKSLDDALTSLDTLTRSTSQDEAVLRQVQTTRAHLVATSGMLAADVSALAAAARQAAATATTLSTSRAERSAYIDSLAAQKRLTRGALASLVARARAAQLRTARIARQQVAASPVVSISPAAAATPAPASRPAAGSRSITVTATGYSMGGTTSTGLPVGWGVAAVDPSVIPLGSRLTIPGYGEAVAADTGGLVIGATVDLWFPTLAQANAWGRRIVTIVVH